MILHHTPVKMSSEADSGGLNEATPGRLPDNDEGMDVTVTFRKSAALGPGIMMDERRGDEGSAMAGDQQLM